jgi:predicted Zn finger-like uncharacterized protein
MAISVTCPSCSAVLRVADSAAGKTGRCPKCQGTITIPAAAPPPPAPVIDPIAPPAPDPVVPMRRDRPIMSRSPGRAAPARVSDYEKDTWIRFWATCAGIFLLVGFFFPILIPQFSWGARESTTKAVWTWDMWEKQDADVVMALLFPLPIGIAAIFCALGLKKMPRAVVLLLLALIPFGLLYFSAGGSTPMGRASPFGAAGKGDTGPAVVFLLALIAALAIAVGNHARKTRPESVMAKMMAGLGGCLLALSLLLPVFDEKPLLWIFTEGKVWEALWPFLLVFLLIIPYAVCGICSFVIGEGGLQAVLSILGRILLIGLPASLFLAMMIAGGKGRGSEGMFGYAFTLTVKGFALFYGYYVLLGASLAAVLDEALPAPKTRNA